MPAQRVPVTSHRRPRQSPPWSEGRHIVDRCPGQGQEGFKIETGGGRHPLDLAQERDHVVGGNAGRGVVGGPIGVVHLDHPPTQGKRDLARHGLTADGEGHARGQAGGPDDGVGERDQRVEGGPARDAAPARRARGSPTGA